MVMTPDTKFMADLASEAALICFTAGSLKRGNYQKGGFLITPNLLSGVPNSVHFPNLGYSNSFWREIAKMPHNDYAKPYPPTVLYEVTSKLTPTPPQPELWACWSRLAPKFWSICATQLHLASSISKIRHISLLPTLYGSRGSFYPQKTKSGYIIHLSHRADFSVFDLARTILLALYKIDSRRSAEIGELSWDRRQAAVDFALTHSPLTRIFPTPKYQKPTSQDYAASKAYLSMLGLLEPAVPDLAKLRPNLTVSEFLLLEKLMATPNQPVDYGTLGDVVWGAQVGDKYSLYALTKHVQNLRRKLSQAGYDPHLLKTSPSLGYYVSL